MVPSYMVSHVAGMITEDPELLIEFTATAPYINPDKMFEKVNEAYTFIYTTDGEMYYGGWNTKHWELIQNTPALRDRYKVHDTYSEIASSPPEDNLRPPESDDLDDVWARLNQQLGRGLQEDTQTRLTTVPQVVRPGRTDIQEPREIAMITGDLLGRLGRDFQYIDDHGLPDTNVQLVSFWNTKKTDYDNSLEGCLQKLREHNLINDETLISTPIHQTIPITAIDQVETQEIDPEMAEKVKLWQQLHLMRPEAKKEAMRKLGLGGEQMIKNPWQQGLEQTGHASPGNKWWAPTSEACEKLDALLEWIDEEEPSEEHPDWIDPDSVMGAADGITFIYAADLNRLLTTANARAHIYIYRDDPQLMARYEKLIPPPESYSHLATIGVKPEFARSIDIRTKLGDVDLFGRSGDSIVSFWNTKPELYKRYLRPCLEALLRDGHMEEDWKVSTPIHGTISIEEALAGVEGTRDASDASERELLHLMGPDEKKSELQRRGLTGPPNKGWQQPLERSGHVSPGNKWWAPTSESVIGRIADLLTDDPDIVKSV